MQISRIMLAGTHSGVGKTTLSTAMMAALSRKGLKVQPFKVGPDYIDPGYHHLATGMISRNLDPWMLGEERVRELLARNALDKDIAVIEGVMGLFDGTRGNSADGSSAHVAKLTQTPVILIVDVRSMARSAAALIHGFLSYDPELYIAGLILNRVGSDSHFNMLKEAIQEITQVPILGYFPKNKNIEMPERHLGLVPTAENGFLGESLEEMIRTLNQTIDLDALIKIAEEAGEYPPVAQKLFSPDAESTKVRIAVAKDEAFNFYYQDGLDYLVHLGAELVPFSPIHDRGLPPEVDGLIIGGGFPEMFLPELTANQEMLASIRQAHQNAMPIYAECGGLMYLSQWIQDFTGQVFSMVKLLPFGSSMQKRLVAMGYVKAVPQVDSLIGKAGVEYRGHEFHYSQLELEDAASANHVKIVRNRDGREKYEGYSNGRLMASYVHLHFAAHPAGAQSFLSTCLQYQAERRGNNE